MRASNAAALQRRILGIAVAALLVLGGTVAAVGIVPLHRELLRSSEAHLHHVLDLKGVAAQETLTRLRALAGQVTSRTVIRDALARHNAGQMPLDELRRFSTDKLTDAMGLSREIVGLTRRARDGAMVVALGEVPRPEDHDIDGVGSPYPPGKGGRIAVGAPIHSRSGAVEGRDVLVADAAALAAIVADRSHLGETGEAVLVLADGSSAFPRRRAEPVAEAAARARATPGRPVLVPGDDVVAAATVAGTDWVLAVRMSATELHGAVEATLLRAGLAAGLALLLGAGALYAVLRPLSGRMLVYASDMEQQLEQQRQTSAALEKTARTLRTLSAGNQSVLRAADERDLLHGMCEAVVETGGYDFVWVGLAAAPGMPPQAAASRERDGREADLDALANALLAWLPFAEATRQGRQLTVDLAQPELPAGLRQAAAALGAGAAVFVPFRRPGAAVFGGILIGGRSVEEFGEAELALLREMGGDLCYGLTTLRLRQAHDAARDALKAAFEQTIQAVATVAEVRDPYTAGHQRRTARLAVAIGEAMGLPEEQVRGLFIAGVVHDVGKVAVPAEILTRPGRLDPDEYELIKAHPQVGYEMLRDIDLPWPVAAMVHQHHERLDGSGYPLGRRGAEIILEARILAVADVVEAIAANRPYRPGLGLDAALEEIGRNSGTLYDSAVVEACRRILAERPDLLAEEAPSALQDA